MSKKLPTKSIVYILLLLVVSLITNAQEVIIPGLYEMPKTSVAPIPQKHRAKKDAVRVDLHRFMGFENVPARYLSLPYDTFQNRNMEGMFTDVGLLLFWVLPLVLLFSNRKMPTRKKLVFNLAVIVGFLLMLIVSIPTGLMNQEKLSTPKEALTFLASNPPANALNKISHQVTKTTLELYTPIHGLFTSELGDWLTYPLLMLIFTGLFFLLYARMRSDSKITKAMLFFLAVYFGLWWILGAGAAWYGMLIFCLPYIFVVKSMLPKSGEKANKGYFSNMRTNVFYAACLIWLFMAFTFRATNYNVVDKEWAKHIYIPPFTEYQTNHLSEKEFRNMIFSKVGEIQAVVNSNENALVYRVGTQLKFFIKKNDSRVYDDTYLDFFNSMVKKFKTKEKIIKALKLSGVEYILFDLNLGSNDKTPEKALIRKFTNFLNTLYNNPQVELVVTDRVLKSNSNGQRVFGVFPDGGSIAVPGQVALFRIK